MNPGDEFVIADRLTRRHILAVEYSYSVVAECGTSYGRSLCRVVPDADHPEWSDLPRCKTCAKRAGVT